MIITKNMHASFKKRNGKLLSLMIIRTIIKLTITEVFMSTKIQDIGSELESGRIPNELNILRTLGHDLKENPQKYIELRNAIVNSNSDEDKIKLLKQFVITEEKLRSMVVDNKEVEPQWITITTITITLIPTVAY